MSKIQQSTRRDFLKTAGAAVAAPYVITSAALWATPTVRRPATGS